MAGSIWAHNWRPRVLLDIGLVLKINNISFYFRLFPGKTNDKNFQKIQKLYFGTIWAFYAQIWTKVNFHGILFLSCIIYSTVRIRKTSLQKEIKYWTNKSYLSTEETSSWFLLTESLKMTCAKSSAWFLNFNQKERI